MKKIISLCLTCITLSLMQQSCSKNNSDTAGNTIGAGGSIARMATVGNYLYIINNLSLFTYDITHPAQATLVHTMDVASNIETLFPYKNKLFIGSQQGMYVYDLSSPTKPTLQGTAQHFRACDPVVADDHYAYVTLRNNNPVCGGTLNQLNIYDIQDNNLLTPKLTGSLMMTQPYGLGYKNNTLYVCMGDKGLNVIDISTKDAPKVIKTMVSGENFIDVIPYHNLLIAYIQGGVILYDITDAINPQKLAILNN